MVVGCRAFAAECEECLILVVGSRALAAEVTDVSIALMTSCCDTKKRSHVPTANVPVILMTSCCDTISRNPAIFCAPAHCAAVHGASDVKTFQCQLCNEHVTIVTSFVRIA